MPDDILRRLDGGAAAKREVRAIVTAEIVGQCNGVAGEIFENSQGGI